MNEKLEPVKNSKVAEMECIVEQNEESIDNKMAHLFKWPSFQEYQERFLQTFALPIGAKGRIKYNKRWINDSFSQIIKKINEKGSFPAIFWLVKGTKISGGQGKSEFNYAIPIRSLTITHIDLDKANCDYYIEFIAGQFFPNFDDIYDSDRLKNFTGINFDTMNYPLPCNNKGYIHVGIPLKFDLKNDEPDLLKLYNQFKIIPLYDENAIPNEKYPIIWIKEIKECELRSDGIYNIELNKQYKIEFSYYQGLKHDRKIRIFSKNFKNTTDYYFGTSNFLDILFLENIKESDKIYIECECDDLKFNLILFENVTMNWVYVVIILYFLNWALIGYILALAFTQNTINNAPIFAAVIAGSSSVMSVFVTFLLDLLKKPS